MKKNKYIFWVSYSDLMTSLFFIMLVLFVLSIGYLKSTLDTTKEKLKKIEELQTAVQELPKNYFQYQPEYKRFKLKKQILFNTGSSIIKRKYHNYLINVGKSIQVLINDLGKNKKYKNMDIKYLVVIEGMASKDRWQGNFELSYKRALSLYKLWKNNGIVFNPKICEIHISGSGIDGIREYSGKMEKKNQQFLIHIIPKIGKIENL